MLREIYFRNPTDPKYDGSIETNSKIEAVLSKIRMILQTTQGDVIGEPTLGMNQENYLFDQAFDESNFRSQFNAQISKFIPESNEFTITVDFSMETDGVKNYIYVYILIDSMVQMGILL